VAVSILRALAPRLIQRAVDCTEQACRWVVTLRTQRSDADADGPDPKPRVACGDRIIGFWGNGSTR
jgi:hypothetical protein